jgi:hypothetical protein
LKKRKLTQSNSKRTIKLWNHHWFRGVAATFFSLLSGWFYNSPIFSSKSSPIYNKLINSGEGLVEQTNNSSKPQIITLSDGSSVLLQ